MAAEDFFTTSAPSKPTDEELLRRMRGVGNVLEIPRPSTGSYDYRERFGSMPTAMPTGGIDPRVVNAVIGKESGGNPNARGKAGEIGLMQIMPATARRMGVPAESLADPNVNVQTGTRLLSQLLRKYNGDLYKTLAAYNAGEGAVDRGKIPQSTQLYVQDILRRMGSNMGQQGPMLASQAQFDPRGSIQGPPQGPLPPPPSLLARLQGAWGPGTAQAAEGPPSAADLERDKARRAAATPPGPGAVPDESNAPWLVKAGGWLPTIGQTVGDIGVSTAAAPLAVAAGPAGVGVEMGAGALGAGGGYALGEIPNRAIRSWYGYPNPTLRQEEWNTGTAAALGAAGVPIVKVGKALLPATLKAGIKAIPEFEKAGQASEQTMQQVGKRLGVSVDEAKEIAANSKAIRQLPSRAEMLLRRVESLPETARERGLQALRDTIGAYIHEAAGFGNNSLQQLMRMKTALKSIPDRVFYRLYNASRGELEELIDTTLRENKKFLEFPQLRQAIKAAIDETPYKMRQDIYRHFGWMLGPFGLMYTIRGQIGHAVTVMSVGAALLAGSAVVNSPPARRLYLRLLLSKSVPEAILLTRALISALATMPLTQRERQRSAAPESPAAAPPSGPPEEPSAGPSARAEMSPAPPSESTLEIPSGAPSSAPTPADEAWTE